MSDLPTLPEGATLNQELPALPEGATLGPATEEGEAPWRPKPTSMSLLQKDTLKLMAGAADVALFAASAGVAEITSGIAGLIALAISRGDPDWAKERIEGWQDFVTIGPLTEGGKYLISLAVPTLSKADVAITDFAEEKAGGDPLIAAAIKAGILGSIDVAAAAVPGAKVVINTVKMNRMRKLVVADAERLGIDIRLENFADDVADAAKLVGSESRGELAMEYVGALRDAEYLAKLKKNSLYAAALDEKLFVSTSPVRKMGAELTRELDGPFDLDGPNMLEVRRTLNDMHSYKLGFGSGQGLAVHFNKFEMLRKRINGRIRNSASAKYGTQKAALIQIKARIDDFMIVEFNKAVMENGRIISSGGALSGDTQGFLTYLAARKATAEHAWFSDTKVIADLIKKDTTVDQFSQWLIGASAVSKSGSAAVVNKMKLLLGEDHPSIAAVRADFIYELTEPLLQLEPNFKQFANNYDKVLRKNKPLADALGLQESDVAALAAYANVARQLPAQSTFYTLREIIQTVSRLGVGHGIAKGGVRVGFMTKVLNAIGRVEKVTKKEIVSAMVDARFDQPIIPKGTPVYAAFIAGAALTGIEDNK